MKTQPKVWNNPYYVQRLLKPLSYPKFSEGFADRYIPKTWQDEEKAAFNSLLQLDYMGSAEFEFGAFGESFREFIDFRQSFKTLTVGLSGLPYTFFPSNDISRRIHKYAEVHCICLENHVNDLKTFLEACCDKEEPRLKERVRMREALFGTFSQDKYEPSDKSRIVGWYDLNNYWFVTKDGALFRSVLSMLK